MKTDIFLEEARLGARDPILIEHDEKPHLLGVKRRFEAYLKVDLAHVVMLIEQDVLDRGRGGKLLEALLAIHELGVERFPWVPECGSCLVQFEHFIGQGWGEDVAGRLQTGRSRNDQEGAVERLYIRDLLLGVIGQVVELQREVIGLARGHSETVMPGYSHLQHAQPWTFGHYLMRQGFIFERDLERLRALYGRTNLSALGGAAQAGTSWPLDRQRTAALLGHDGIVENANDAGEFARDHLEEAMSVLALMMSNLGRLATDFYLWSSWEFSMIEIDDGLAGTSSIMPQKKNPHALERTKALAGQATGWLPAVMACQRGVLSTDLDMVYGDDLMSQAASSCRDALALMTACLRSLIVHDDVMAARADVYWTTASHLADELVRRFDLPFRTAHHIVGGFVKASIEAGLTVGQASAAMLDKAATELTGKAPGFTDDELRKMLSARHFIESRVTEGSVHPAHVLAQADRVSRRVDEEGDWHRREVERVEAAIAALQSQARRLFATPSTPSESS